MKSIPELAEIAFFALLIALMLAGTAAGDSSMNGPPSPRNLWFGAPIHVVGIVSRSYYEPVNAPINRIVFKKEFFGCGECPEGMSCVMVCHERIYAKLR
jgi:hypothetical protein